MVKPLFTLIIFALISVVVRVFEDQFTSPCPYSLDHKVLRNFQQLRSLQTVHICVSGTWRAGSGTWEEDSNPS